MVVGLRLTTKEAEACGEEGLQVCAAEYVQQWESMFVGAVCAVHQQYIQIGKQELGLFLVGEEEILYAIGVILLDSEDQSAIDKSSSNVSMRLLPFRCFSLTAFLSPRTSVAETR